MSDSNKVHSPINVKHVVLVVIWLVFTTSAFYILTKQKLTLFDPQGKLTDITAVQLSQTLSSLTNTHSGKRLIHISQANCNCNLNSEQHILAAHQNAQINQFEIIQLSLAEHKILPSTPAVALIDDNNDLLYFGPYGAGLYCGETAGYVQTVLNNLSFGYKHPLIAANAKGCYCQLG